MWPRCQALNAACTWAVTTEFSGGFDGVGIGDGDGDIIGIAVAIGMGVMIGPGEVGPGDIAGAGVTSGDGVCAPAGTAANAASRMIAGPAGRKKFSTLWLCPGAAELTRRLRSLDVSRPAR
jgi:hypothetical protein